MKTIQKIEFRQQRESGAVVSATFDFLKQEFANLSKAILSVLVPIIAIGGAVGVIYYPSLKALFQSFEQGSAEALDNVYALSTFFGIAFLLILILSNTIFTLTYSYIKLYVEDNSREITNSDLIEELKDNFFSFFWTTIVVTVALMIPIMLGFMLFVLPGLILTFYLLPYFNIIFSIKFMEGVSPISAIGRAFTLVKGNWISTFIVFIIMFIIQIVLSYIIQIPMMVFMSLSEGDGMMIAIGMSLFSVLYMVTSFVLYIIQVVAGTIQYFNLVERKEGVGLKVKIENIGMRHNGFTDKEDY